QLIISKNFSRIRKIFWKIFTIYKCRGLSAMNNKLSKKEAIEILKRSKNLTSTIESNKNHYGMNDDNISIPISYKKTEDILLDIASKIDTINTIVEDLVSDINSFKKLS
ncbi:MAG: hypothetical protein RSA87_04060, partial [Malacoplasma sp.]